MRNIEHSSGSGSVPIASFGHLKLESGPELSSIAMNFQGQTPDDGTVYQDPDYLRQERPSQNMHNMPGYGRSNFENINSGSAGNISHQTAFAPGPASNSNFQGSNLSIGLSRQASELSLQSPTGYLPSSTSPGQDSVKQVVGSQGRRGVVPAEEGCMPVVTMEEFQSIEHLKGEDGLFKCPSCSKSYRNSKHLARHYNGRKYFCWNLFSFLLFIVC
jgi:hypothetical protein